VDTAQLVALCRAGDALAVETLVRDYHSAVFRLALSILDDADEAGEAVQDAFVAALDALDSYQGDAALTTWLYSITLNVCRARLRKRRALAGLMAALRAAFPLKGNPPPDPETSVIQSQTDARVWKAVMALDEKHRLPVILRYYHDLSIVEIAHILGISEGTVHSRLHTARERMRVALYD